TTMRQRATASAPPSAGAPSAGAAILRGRRPDAAVILAVCLALLAGCASAPPGESSPEAPEIDIAQERSDVLFLRGPIPLTFVLTVRNTLDVPVTLRRVELRTVGTGSYRLRTEAVNLDRTIAAGATETFGLHTWGRSRG